MSTLIEEKANLLIEKREAERLVDAAGIAELEAATRPYTLADAIREGATVSGQAYNWTDNCGNLCALSAAVVAAKSRKFL